MEANNPSNGIRSKLTHLRAQLIRGEQNKSLLAQLRAHLSAAGISSTELEPSDEESLDLLAAQALAGVDIPTQYPAFFYKLLVNANLRRAFLETLAALEQMGAGISPVQPPPSTPSLEFLKKVPPKPVVQWWRKQEWRVTWQQTIAQLESIFLPTPAEFASRAPADLSKDAQYLLFRSQVQVEAYLLDVSLDATHQPDQDRLNLVLSVGLRGNELPLFATLRWGRYGHTLPISAQPLHFPPLSTADILDPTGEHIAGPLSLQIATSVPKA